MNQSSGYPGIAQSNTKVSERTGQTMFQTNYEEHDRIISDISVRLNDLRDKLQPVLNVDLPEVDKAYPSQPQRSPLFMAIDMQNTRLRSILSEMNKLIERIDF